MHEEWLLCHQLHQAVMYTEMLPSTACVWRKQGHVLQITPVV